MKRLASLYVFVVIALTIGVGFYIIVTSLDAAAQDTPERAWQVVLLQCGGGYYHGAHDDWFTTEAGAKAFAEQELEQSYYDFAYVRQEREGYGVLWLRSAPGAPCYPVRFIEWQRFEIPH